jgi:hypothetical protein
MLCRGEGLLFISSASCFLFFFFFSFLESMESDFEFAFMGIEIEREEKICLEFACFVIIVRIHIKSLDLR